MNLFSENTRPLKLCIFAPRAYPYFNPEKRALLGGAELQLYNLATELAKDRKFSVNVVVKEMPVDQELREGVMLHNIYIPEGKAKYFHVPSVVFNLFRVLKKVDADVYLERGATYQTGLIAFFCKLYGKKFLYMAAHDGDTNPALNPYRSGFVRRIFWWVFESGLKRADAIVVQNERQVRDLQQYYGRDSHLRMSAHRFQALAEPPLTKDLVLWVARGEDWKRPEVFIGLAQELPKQKFLMIMPESPRFEAYAQAIKERAKQIDNLEFIDFVPPNQIDRYFERALVFVNTSTHEGFPNTFIQAAKARTPILSLAVNPNNMISNFGLGIFADNDLSKLKQGLVALLLDKDFWVRSAENVHAYARANHDLEKIIEDDKRILQSLFEPGA